MDIFRLFISITLTDKLNATFDYKVAFSFTIGEILVFCSSSINNLHTLIMPCVILR